MGPSFPPISSGISWGGSAKVNRFVSVKPTEPCGRCAFMGAMIPEHFLSTRSGDPGEPPALSSCNHGGCRRPAVADSALTDTTRNAPSSTTMSGHLTPHSGEGGIEDAPPGGSDPDPGKDGLRT